MSYFKSGQFNGGRSIGGVDVEHVLHRRDEGGVGLSAGSPGSLSGAVLDRFVERAADRIELHGRHDSALDDVLHQQPDGPKHVTERRFGVSQRG
jgi:hypothetical protein